MSTSNKWPSAIAWQLSSAIAYHCSCVFVNSVFTGASCAFLSALIGSSDPSQRLTRQIHTRHNASKQHIERVSELLVQVPTLCSSSSSSSASEQGRECSASVFMQHPQGFAAPSDQHQINSYAAPAQQYLSDCSRVLVFNEAGQVLFSRSCQASPAELQSLQGLFGTREEALHTGILLDNRRYEVHRHHVDGPEPLVYGRTMSGDPETTEGAAVHKLVGTQPEGSVYSVVTYEMPNISARVVSQLLQFSAAAFPRY